MRRLLQYYRPPQTVLLLTAKLLTPVRPLRQRAERQFLLPTVPFSRSAEASTPSAEALLVLLPYLHPTKNNQCRQYCHFPEVHRCTPLVYSYRHMPEDPSPHQQEYLSGIKDHQRQAATAPQTRPLSK